MRLRHFLLFFVFFAALLLLAGCGMSEGTVRAKEYAPGYLTSSSTSVCDSKGMCTVIPIMIWIPECWIFVLQQGEDVGQICVDNSVWIDYRVGDYYRESE